MCEYTLNIECIYTGLDVGEAIFDLVHHLDYYFLETFFGSDESILLYTSSLYVCYSDKKIIHPDFQVLRVMYKDPSCTIGQCEVPTCFP